MNKIKYLIAFIALVFLATSAGPNSGATFSSDATIGNVAWSNPGNAQTSNGVRATTTPLVTDDVTEYLKATNFGFSLPNSTVDGIVVEAQESSVFLDGDPATENSIKIVKSGTIQGQDKSAGANIPDPEAYVTYGGSSDLWQLTWAYTDINASNFGAVFSFSEPNAALGNTAQIDHIRITVYYTETATGVKKRVIGYGGGATKIEACQ